nr:hypothetical protein [uncultured Duganella sp.]
MRKPIAAMMATLALALPADSALADRTAYNGVVGREVLKRDLTTVDWARSTGSVTNYLNWYKSPEPRIVLTTATRTLEIEDAGGTMRTFQL